MTGIGKQAYAVRSPELAFAAGEFFEAQKTQMGDFFTESWARTKQGFSLLWSPLFLTYLN